MRHNDTEPVIKKYIKKAPIIKRPAKLIYQLGFNRQTKRQISAYNTWLEKNASGPTELESQNQAAQKLKYRPLISIITPTFNTPEKFLHQTVNSVLGQTYNQWELVLVDDKSTQARVREVIQQFAAKDKRIKYQFLSENRHISAATNAGIKISSGDFIGLLDHDDILRPNALYEVASALNSNKDLDFIYSDEDKIKKNPQDRFEPFLKPGWNRDFLYSVNYITHFAVIRKKVIDKVGGERTEFNGAQDWELFLRVVRNIPQTNILHIPKILYSWRVHESSTAGNIMAKPYVIDAQKKAISSDLRSKNLANATLNQDPDHPAQWQLWFTPKHLPKISIAVYQDIADQANNEIQKHTDYPDYEVIVISPKTSYKNLLNQLSGEYLIIVSRPLQIIDLNWISQLMGDAERSDIGFVLAGLKSERDIMKIVANLLEQPAIELLATMNRRNLTKHLYTSTRYNVPTVYAGLAMIKVDKLHDTITDQQAELNLARISTDVTAAGLRNLYNPNVRVLK